MLARLLRLFLVALAGVGGGTATAILEYALGIPDQKLFKETYPLPHQIPKYPGGISLRLAMVHDTIHERYARHGLTYYEARNKQVRQEVATLRAKDPKQQPGEYEFALLDDLGAGLDHLGQHDEAVRTLSDKLKRQQELGLNGRVLYTSYANLGTFLIHGNFAKARDGDPHAVEDLREGALLIRKAIEVNPEAHFGREVWQAHVVEFFLTVLKDPPLLLKYDVVGKLPADSWGQCAFPTYGRELGSGRLEHLIHLPEKELSAEERQMLRDFIYPAHATKDWSTPNEAVAVRFDEPTLGILGMWRYGGGPNPHFALALGGLMLGVGQGHIAWAAHQRAIDMSDRFWPDAKMQQRLCEYCRERQKVIEQRLPEAERAQLRPRYEQELAFGLGYQQAYQDYEAQCIASGKSLDDPH